MCRWLWTVMAMLLLTQGCAGRAEPNNGTPPSQIELTQSTVPTVSIRVPKIENLRDDFMFGADVSSLISLENSGCKFYGFDGARQDVLKTLCQAGVDHIRVRVWKDPFDADGNGYGGGNCDLENAISIGRRAAQYGMGLLVDFHYSDFWADPAKQQLPKAWQELSFDEKEGALCAYTADSLRALMNAGVRVSMVQIGNETTGGFCGETSAQGQYRLMAAAAEAVREAAPDARIVVHFTNPEKGNYLYFAEKLKEYRVDYDVFASSYYGFWHGSVENLTSQLEQIIRLYGKQVMIAETSWAYTGTDADDHRNSVDASMEGSMPYDFSVQGQADALSALVAGMADLGEGALGVFYWEPAWIPVPGSGWKERSEKWEAYGSGWASSYAGEYDPQDAGRYYGGSACDNQTLFDGEGHPLDSLLTFAYLRTGT